MSVATLFIMFGFFWMAIFTIRRARWGWRGDDLRDRLHGNREQSEALDRMNALLADMSNRLDRLEEERDFYRELLGSSARFRKELPTEQSETPRERSGGGRP